MSEDNEERQAKKQIVATFEQIDVWSRTPLFTPNVGAELRGDDDEWPWMATSQLAKVGLDVAAEHFKAIVVLIKSNVPFTFAFRSILRTALVGATQSVWLLAPDDREERARRLRVLVRELYRRHLQYLDSLLELSDLYGDPRDANTQKVRDHAATRLTQIDTVRTLAGEKAAWNDTDAIKAAAVELFSKDANKNALVHEASLEWMAGSGVSHGLIWPILGSPGAGPAVGSAPDKHGRVAVSAGGSMLRIVNSYMLAYEMTKKGWSLLRQRGL